MRRVGALLGAVAMVVAALVLRGALGGGGDGSPVDADGSDAVDGDRAGLVCAADLAEVCRAAGLDVVATPRAGTTADRLLEAGLADDLGGRAWITTRAWADLVVAERDRLGLDPLFSVSAPLGRDAVRTLVWADRAAALRDRGCTDVDARCLAEASGVALPSGDRVVLRGPDVDTALGLPVAASQVAALTGRRDVASNDFDATFRDLAARLAAAQDGDPLTRMRTRGPGDTTAAATVGTRATQTASSFGTLEVTDVDLVWQVEVVALVPAGADLPGGVADDLGAALAEAGWTVPGFPPPDDDLLEPPADAPPGGVLAAIRTVWNEGR